MSIRRNSRSFVRLTVCGFTKIKVQEDFCAVSAFTTYCMKNALELCIDGFSIYELSIAL